MTKKHHIISAGNSYHVGTWTENEIVKTKSREHSEPLFVEKRTLHYVWVDGIQTLIRSVTVDGAIIEFFFKPGTSRRVYANLVVE